MDNRLLEIRFEPSTRKRLWAKGKESPQEQIQAVIGSYAGVLERDLAVYSSLTGGVSGPPESWVSG